ncbi:DUF4374 domain-containing protein [Aquimarina macrocephali]|uniref:DUF4374 domain-containing protein n=1 Tax=Aquimarina macrocephali TaxID=666563 RepID=UPI000465E6ED|nr:DUF4374 domain-containing protein [Aquimarina macrocephali]
MKTNTLKKAAHILFTGFIFTTIIILSGCKSDDNSIPPEETTVKINHGLAIVSGAGDVKTTFIQGLTNLNNSSIDNSSSTEVGQFSSIYSDGKSMFTAGFGAPATMKKFVFDKTGKAILDQEIIIPGSNSFSSLEILNETTGYATVGGGISKVIQFNPTTMRITGEINLKDAGDGLFYSDMIIRDTYLFITLNDFGGSGIAKIAVVDLNTNSLSKIITDDRTATLFNTLTSEIMTADAQGDIYIQASGLFSDKPSGVLRIKAGETEFDKDYFFDLKAATGKTCFGLYHFGNGVACTTISENDDNFFGTDGANPAFRYRKINLSNTTDLGDLEASLPNTFAASRTSFMKQVSEEEVLFAIAGTEEDALYSFEISSGTVSRKMKSNSGYITGLISLK